MASNEHGGNRQRRLDFLSQVEAALSKSVTGCGAYFFLTMETTSAWSCRSLVALLSAHFSRMLLASPHPDEWSPE
jgi:hypothetical protein